MHRARHILLRIRRHEAAQDAHRFALAEDRPLFAFAGLWTPWRGVRGPKSAPVEGDHELFGFLTAEANAIVAPIHAKAMPVILTTSDEVDRWLEADAAEALALLWRTTRCASSPRGRDRTTLFAGSGDRGPISMGKRSLPLS